MEPGTQDNASIPLKVNNVPSGNGFQCCLQVSSALEPDDVVDAEDRPPGHLETLLECMGQLSYKERFSIEFH